MTEEMSSHRIDYNTKINSYEKINLFTHRALRLMHNVDGAGLLL